jgi:diacylglycerol kinase family enzyme
VAWTLSSAFAVERVETERPGHATQLAADAAAGRADVIAVLGGDGTVNEAANALAGTDVPLALIPAGGTNVLARSLGLPGRAADAARLIVRRGGRAGRRIPLGLIAGDGRRPARRFVCNCGLGFDGAIVREVERRQRAKRRMGDGLFVWTGLRLFVSGYDRRDPHVHVTWDAGRIEGQFMAVVQNLSPFTYLGRLPLRLCPDAGLEAGLDCFALDSMRTPVVLRVLMRSFRRRGPRDDDHVTHVRDRRELVLRSDVPMPAQADGEYLGEREELALSVEPEALSILV